MAKAVKSDAAVKKDPQYGTGAGAHTPSDDEIRQRAYEIWEREGHPHNKSSDHWEQARRELMTNDPAAAEDQPAKPKRVRKPRAKAETPTEATPAKGRKRSKTKTAE